MDFTETRGSQALPVEHNKREQHSVCSASRGRVSVVLCEPE